MPDKKTIKLQFAPDQTSPMLEIANGEYHRKFAADEQPFECEPEEAAALLRSGHFVAVSEEQSADAAKSKELSAKSEESALPASAGGSKKAAAKTDGEEQSAKS